VAADRVNRHAQFHGGIEGTRAIQVQAELVGIGELAREVQIFKRQHLPAHRVLQAQQSGTREMVVVGLDRSGHLPQIEGAIRTELQGLRLDAAQYRRATAFVFVGVRLLADDVFVPALAMAQQGDEVALGAAADEHRGFHAEHVGGEGFEFIDGRIFAIDIVAHLRGGHGTAHRRSRSGDGVASQINHGVPRAGNPANLAERRRRRAGPGGSDGRAVEDERASLPSHVLLAARWGMSTAPSASKARDPQRARPLSAFAYEALQAVAKRCPGPVPLHFGTLLRRIARKVTGSRLSPG
jgi:hypothetical protein